jgi:hypothetical protein
MKIAYIFDPGNLHSTTYSGVVRQGLTWAKGLSNFGVEVEFPVAHETFDWTQCDLVHLFQYGSWAEPIIAAAARYNIPVILSPIVDRSAPYGWRGRVASKIPFEFFGLRQRHRTLSTIMRSCERVLARSELEKSSLRDISTKPSKIEIVRLGIESPPDLLRDAAAKSAHVFHMSHLNQGRKNVRALVQACRSLGVPLRLAGKISDPEFAAWLNRQCEAHSGLTYLGTLSEKRKWEEMGAARVFCLPSLNEGIGLVALEAYLAGAQIVLTERTGGVEYFDGDIEVCNPASIESIAYCIDRALKKPVRNGTRLDDVKRFSNEASVDKLFKVYKEINPHALNAR